MENETMVNETNEQAEDELLDEVVEEETDDESEDLESAFTEDTDQQSGDNGKKDQDQGTRSEPGYVKSRIEKAVAKAIAQTKAEMQASFDQQLAPYKDQLIAMEAQELVRSGKVKDLETAKELVRYRQGQPAVQEKQEQPSNAQGQFAPKQTEDAGTSARIDMLKHQADRIREQRGIDVISEFQKNEEVKQKIISGEWDFYDLAEEMSKPKKKTPAPMRSPNGANGIQATAIWNMTDEQFDKMDQRIHEGARYRLK